MIHKDYGRTKVVWKALGAAEGSTGAPLGQEGFYNWCLEQNRKQNFTFAGRFTKSMKKAIFKLLCQYRLQYSISAFTDTHI